MATIEKQEEEIKALRAVKVEYDEKACVTPLFGPSGAADAKTIEDLKRKCEEMVPLYNVGLIVRGRTLNCDSPRTGGPSWQYVLHESGDAIYGGRARADASMVLEFSREKRATPDQFEKCYGINPYVGIFSTLPLG